MAAYYRYGYYRASPLVSNLWWEYEESPIGAPINADSISWAYLNEDLSPIYTDYPSKTYFGTTNPPPLVYTGETGYAGYSYTLPSTLTTERTYYIMGWTQEYGYSTVGSFTSQYYFSPPVSLGGVDSDGDGYGDDGGIGGYDLATKKRLVIASDDMIWYEDI